MWDLTTGSTQDGFRNRYETGKNSSKTELLKSAQKKIKDGVHYYDKRTLWQRNINAFNRSVSEGGTNSPTNSTARARSAPALERQKLESDLEVAIGNNATAIRPSTAFEKYKTRSEAKLLLSEQQSHPRYYAQQMIRRKLSNKQRLWETEKLRRERSDVDPGKKEFIGFMKRDGGLFMVTKLSTPNKSTTVDGVSKLLSEFKIDAPSNEEEPEDTVVAVNGHDDDDQEQHSTILSLSSLKTPAEADDNGSNVSFIDLAERPLTKGDLSLSGNRLDSTVALENKEDGSQQETSNENDDCSECLVCIIERIVNSAFSDVTDDVLRNDEEVATMTKRICDKINEEMSVPEDVSSDLEIHIRRLLASRILDQRNKGDANSGNNLKYREANISSDKSKGKPSSGTGDGVEESVGILYAENKYEKAPRGRDSHSARKLSLSGSPINIVSSKNDNSHIASLSSAARKQPQTKTEKAFRFSYTHARRNDVTNTSETSAVSDELGKERAAANFSISLNIYKNKQYIARRLKTSEARSFRACLHPRINASVDQTSSGIRQRDARHIPDRLGDWYWKRLDEIERHRCPPPPNSPVPAEWETCTDM